MAKHALKDIDNVTRNCEILNLPLNELGRLTPDTAWNGRKIFNKEKLEELSRNIESNGITTHLVVRKESNETLLIRQGARRLEAINILLERGGSTEKLSHIPLRVITKQSGITDEDLIISDVNSNSGVNLTAIEEGLLYKRLSDEYGYSKKDIEKKFGKSYPTVCQRFKLAEAPEAIRNALLKEEITTQEALKLLKSGEDEYEQTKQLEEVKEERAAKTDEDGKVKRAVRKKSFKWSFNKVDPTLVDCPEDAYIEVIEDFLSTLNEEDKATFEQAGIDWKTLTITCKEMKHE